MKSHSQNYHDGDVLEKSAKIIENVRRLSDENAWRFYLNPPKEVLPDFLNGYVPDAIGIGENGGIVVEIKTQKSDAADRSLSAIARLISQQKGWDFRVYYLYLHTQSSSALPIPSLSQINSTMDEIKGLVHAGFTRPAFILSWSLLEALARLVLAQGGINDARITSPIQVIQALAQEAIIENADAKKLRELSMIRNNAVHGNLSLEISYDSLEELLDIIQKVISSIQTVD